VTASTRVEEFEQLRPHLLAVAYRLTGTLVDAEDIVQEAWLRWDANRHTSIDDLKAYRASGDTLGKWLSLLAMTVRHAWLSRD